MFFIILVNYLNYLDSNDTAYLEYHQWRYLVPDDLQMIKNEKLKMFSKSVEPFCDMCDYVRNARKNNFRQAYQSVLKFWRYDVDSKCKSKTKFPAYIKDMKTPNKYWP